MPGSQRTANVDRRAGDGAGSGEGAAGVDGHGARDRAVDDQRAAFDGGRTGIGVDAGQSEGAGALLGERAAGIAAAAGRAVLDDTRKCAIHILAANRKVFVAQEHIAAAFDRTDRRSPRGEEGNIEAAAVQFDTGGAAARLLLESDEPIRRDEGLVCGT